MMEISFFAFCLGVTLLFFEINIVCTEFCTKNSFIFCTELNPPPRKRMNDANEFQWIFLLIENNNNILREKKKPTNFVKMIPRNYDDDYYGMTYDVWKNRKTKTIFWTIIIIMENKKTTELTICVCDWYIKYENRESKSLMDIGREKSQEYFCG